MGAWLLIFVYLLLISPLRMGAALSWEKGQLPRAALGVLIWGIPLQAQIHAVREPGGQLRLESSFQGKPQPQGPDLGGVQRIWPLLKGLKRADIARKLFRASLHLKLFEIHAEIGVQSAACIGLLSGLLRGAASLFPFLRCRIQPNFGGSSALHARCIVESRLGMLLLAGLLAAISYRAAAKKEEQPWIIPSGN